jgi:hypothetical protein
MRGFNLIPQTAGPSAAWDGWRGMTNYILAAPRVDRIPFDGLVIALSAYNEEISTTPRKEAPRKVEV